MPPAPLHRAAPPRRALLQTCCGPLPVRRATDHSVHLGPRALAAGACRDANLPHRTETAGPLGGRRARGRRCRACAGDPDPPPQLYLHSQERLYLLSCTRTNARARARARARGATLFSSASHQVLKLGRHAVWPREQKKHAYAPIKGAIKGANTWSQFAKVVAFLRLAAQRAEPLVAKARSCPRPPSTSPRSLPIPLDLLSTPLDRPRSSTLCTLSHVPRACLAFCRPKGGRRHLRTAAAAARPFRAAPPSNAPWRRAPSRRSLRILLVDAAGCSF